MVNHMKIFHSAYFCCFCDKISFDSAIEAKNHIVQVSPVQHSYVLVTTLLVKIHLLERPVVDVIKVIYARKLGLKPPTAA